MRLALVALLLAGCATDLGGYRVRYVPEGVPILHGGREVRALTRCLSREVFVHRGDDEALFHELRHVDECCRRGVDCRQD